MKTSKKKYIGNVRGLEVYKKALQFHKIIYGISETLPASEQNNLSDTFRRSCTSIVANIAEGNTNYYYKKEYSHLNMVLSKISVCRSALDICQVLGYIPEPEYKYADTKSEELLKMVIGMMRRIERFLDIEQDEGNSEEIFDKSMILPTDLLEVCEKVITLNAIISDLVLQYPIIESNNIKDQITRSSKSTLQNLNKSKKTSNSQSYLDLNTSLGSISETIALFDMSYTQGYLSKDQYVKLNTLGKEIMVSLIEMMNQKVQFNNDKPIEVYVCTK